MITNQRYIELFDAARDVVEQYYFDQIIGAIDKTSPEVMRSKINKLTMILYSKKENDHLLFKVEKTSQINNIITNSEKLIEEVYKYIDNAEVSMERDILDPANKLAQAIADYKDEREGKMSDQV